MINWLLQHIRALSRALRSLATQPLGTLLSALVIGIALSMPAGGYLLLDNIAALVKGVSGTPEISLFLDTQAQQNDIAAIEKRLKAETMLSSYRYISKQDALKQLQQSGLGDVLGSLKTNPLPDAFIVTVHDNDPTAFEHLTATMQSWPKVAHIQHDSAWVKRLNALIELGRLAVLILAVLLGFALIVVTFNTIRLQIMTQRQEIEISRLLGATDPFIRRPFYWFGILQGVLGGTIALGAVWLGIYILTPAVTSLAQTYGAVFSLIGPSWQETAALIVFAGLLGWFGSVISVRRYLAAC